MYTGLDVFEDVGQIVAWRGDEVMPRRIYTGECAELTGK